MKYNPLITAILLFCSIIAQTQNYVCDIPFDNNNIVFSSTPLSDSLTKVVVVTNRPYLPDDVNMVYFPNAIANFRKITYLEVSCADNKWLIHLLDGFDEGMKSIDDGKDILLYIHGHGKDLHSSLHRAFKVRNRYNVSMILFDWPSQNSNFNKSMARVRRCDDNFYNLLLHLKAYKSEVMNENQHLSAFAHSLGNYFFTHMVVNGDWQYQNEPIFDNLVLNAPAVRSKEHGEVLSLLNISKKMYVTYNYNDRILRGANFLTSGKMLGNVIIEPLAKNTTYVNFTDFAGKQHNYFAGYHQFEEDHPSIFYFYNSVLHGNTPEFKPDYFDMVGDSIFKVK